MNVNYVSNANNMINNNNIIDSNVINKPLDIYDTVIQTASSMRTAYLESMRGIKQTQKVRPPLKISYTIQDNKLIVSFNPPRITPITFTCALRKQEFLQELRNFFLFDNTCCDGGNYCAAFCPSKPHQTERKPFDVARFSLVQQPLKGWKKFSRVMYERESEDSCINVIMRFLQNPANLNLLRRLFLAPDQIDNNPTEKDLAYFRQVPKRCEALSLEDHQIIGSQFQTSYPLISQRIFAELVQENLQKSLAESSDDYTRLLQDLNSQVYGQPEATTALAGVLASQKNSDKCLAFLFSGPSGVGKTELAKAVTKNKANGWVSIRMNEYRLEMHITKFFGSGIGYQGCTDKPHFMQELLKCNPILKKDSGGHKEYEVQEAVILLDEIEKAHPSIKQSLLTVIDEGLYSASYVSDGTNITKTFHLKKCIIIGTSNGFSEQILQAFQKNKTSREIADLICDLNKRFPSPETFSPEFLGRFTSIPFGPIPRGNIYQNLLRKKLDLFFAELRNDYHFRQITVENEPRLLLNMENIVYGNGTQIREVGKFLDRISTQFIQQHKREWGDLKNVKLVFHPQGDQIFAKVIRMVPGFDIEYGNPFADLPIG